MTDIKNTRAQITILDGGMGRELARSGAPFRQPEWSALALMEAPDTVRAAHAAFVAAGAEVVTTNSYALVPFHIGEARFRDRGRELADLAGRLARAPCAGVRVAGSLPPLFGSYRPDLFDAEAAPALLDVLVAGLGPHVDLWLGETLSSIVEARAVREALDRVAETRPLWLSFTLLDDPAGPPRLRSGEPVADAAAAAVLIGAAALLFNCSQPEVMGPAVVDASRAAPGLAIGVYANAFPPLRPDVQANADTGLVQRGDLTPEAYLGWAEAWAADGASIIGGCCGIGPEHIRELAGWRDRRSA